MRTFLEKSNPTRILTPGEIENLSSSKVIESVAENFPTMKTGSESFTGKQF